MDAIIKPEPQKKTIENAIKLSLYLSQTSNSILAILVLLVYSHKRGKYNLVAFLKKPPTIYGDGSNFNPDYALGIVIACPVA